MTLDSDAEDQPVVPPTKSKKKRQTNTEEEAQLDPSFMFDLSAYPFEDQVDSSNVADYVKAGSKPVSPFLLHAFAALKL